MLRRFIRAMVRRLFRLALLCSFVIAVIAILLDLFFTRVQPLRPRIEAAAASRINAYHIHPLTYDQIPHMFRAAIIATEDRRFAWDPGIDPVGIARSLFVDMQLHGELQGGSTITQQLVDNTILNQQKTFMRKLLQVINAIGVYDTMSKQETFTLYTNVIYFGQGAYGLYNASLAYFGQPPANLNTGQLTLLAGLPNAPSDYDPLQNLPLARQRQQLVLLNMVEAGVITKAEAQEIYAEPLFLT